MVIPQGRLSFQFSAANDWNDLQKSLKLESYISLTNFKHQLLEQLTDRCTCTQPICKYPTQLPHPHIVIYVFASLHPSISTSTFIFCTSIYCLTSLILLHLHTLYRFFYCVIDCTFVYPMCKSVLFVSHCFASSWPGRICK